MHMFVGTIVKGISIEGYKAKKLVNPNEISKRHDVLACELIRRGYKHNSPLDFDTVTCTSGNVDVEANMAELHSRCKECQF